MDPTNTLLAGTRILDVVLVPLQFIFRPRDEGQSSGGPFAWGEYKRGDRKLELHFRRGLGMVRYHVASRSVSHEAYMRELGVWEQCQYPGFSAEPLDAFRGLAHDLGFAADFLSGDASILENAAARESLRNEEMGRGLMAGYVGDTRTLEKMHDSFKRRHYAEVVSLFEQLKYPERLTKAQSSMVDIARRRSGGQTPGSF